MESFWSPWEPSSLAKPQPMPSLWTSWLEHCLSANMDQEPSLRAVELPQVPHPLPAGDVWTHFSRDSSAAFLLPNLGFVMDGGRRSHIKGASNLWDLRREKVSEYQKRETILTSSGGKKNCIHRAGVLHRTCRDCAQYLGVWCLPMSLRSQ